MESQQEIDFNRIAKAIAFFKTNFKEQPSLEAAAAHVHVSPYHFQRMFQNWAGVSPKQFLQYISLEYARKRLKETEVTLSETAQEMGLSGTGRLHDLFVKVEGMTPGEYKNGGADLRINYSFTESPFGQLLVASTSKGVCHIAFTGGDEEGALDQLCQCFPRAEFQQGKDGVQQNVLQFFNKDWTHLHEVKLYLKGTPFQLKIWETLLQVPRGGLITYASLAQRAGYNGAHRAVGTAVGANPVAFLIPCHRVIKSTGETGQYHWGGERKSALLGWESGVMDTFMR